MPSDHVLQLCASSETVISALAANPDQEIDRIVKKLFKSRSKTPASSLSRGQDSTDLDRAAQCGKFPYRPSDLFLKIYSDVIDTLDSNPHAGVVSPSLMGSSGVIPLSIVSVIPDIMRHYADLIVHAESEIFLATNYWENSHCAKIITDSMRELSRRVATRNGSKIVMKLMYDRGTPSQVIKNHALVTPDNWEQVGLPTQEEIPHVDLEVVNFHRPLVGTFHAKYLVVDRKIACLNSNNIQDRSNVEMMIHLEGPIVDSFYDMALMSWSLVLNPPLPLLSKPQPLPAAYKFQHNNPSLKYIDAEASSKATREFINKRHETLEEEDAREVEQHGGGRAKDILRKATGIVPAAYGSQREGDDIAQHPNMNVPLADSDQDSNIDVRTVGSARFSDNDPAVKDLTREDDEIAAAARISDDKLVASRINKVTARLNEGIGNSDTAATFDNEDILKDFRPHLLHQAHEPFPIAMVNRQPKGTPGHGDANKIPQDVAWLSAIKYAEQSVFIQTPTFNASPIVPAVLEACRRGIRVVMYLDLGFNDQGEMIPFQGGTNEEVVNKMYKDLNSDGKHTNLLVYWYTAKDQDKPMGATMKKRNCHVKFMSIDGQVAILGNGNQDTQSWFHSQEINVMVDSKELVDEWVRGINSNQNTSLFGQVDSKDGVWRDRDGNVVEATGIKTAGPFGHLKGIGGAIARVRGTGGF